MGTTYRDARLKVERAKKHIADFTASVIALEDACTVTVEQDEQGRELLVHEITNPSEALDNLSLIAGDAIHNLRIALDFAWRSTISRLLPDKLSDHTKFPVRETRQDVEGALHGIEVDTRRPALWDCIIHEIQPYSGGKNPPIVWTLHDLDISDKHLLPIGLDPIGQITGISIRNQKGELDRGFGQSAKGSMGGKYHILFESGLKVEDKGKLSVPITFQEAGILNAIPVKNLFYHFSDFTLKSVHLLENL